jgi:hypothetical protein
MRHRCAPIGVMIFATACAAVSCSDEPAGRGVAHEQPPERPTGPKLEVAELGTSTLRGKISHNGEPIVEGRLFFVAGDALVPLAGNIKDGSYNADDLPEGDLRVCVLLDPAGQLPFPAMPALEGGMAKCGGSDADKGGPGGGPGGKGGPGGGPGGKGGPGGGPGGKAGPGGGPGGKAGPGGGLPGKAGTGGHGSMMSSPEGSWMVPEGIPPRLVDILRGFKVPDAKKELYTKLHAKYAKPGKANPLVVHVGPGTNEFNILLVLP